MGGIGFFFLEFGLWGKEMLGKGLDGMGGVLNVGE